VLDGLQCPDETPMMVTPVVLLGVNGYECPNEILIIVGI
jgi:hypothetical protein